MAPPRQRTTAVQDDSRSEASSTTTKELKAAAAKSRKGPNVGNATAVSRDVKATSNVTSAPATQGEQSDNLPRIPWSEMPLEFLHSYRHAYKLTCPSAHSSEYAHNLLSRGIGLLSPTAIAARRAQNHSSQQSDGSLKSHHIRSRPNGISGTPQNSFSKRSGPHNGKGALNHIISQDRVAKSQLATAVRKHFNSAGLVEQEAIARFLYKVREEGRGRHFRLKFQP
ncbi:histone deacetylase complex subunit SAP30 Sin3-binding domain-containing protein [Aspergillus foveolatus]|uniref:histone deacetylase complex subunit SAP30 Sin3-binding domain-containing protein n=1 Tax=Aspergillus foveolatus TaxID=210207 RepID=UPI003CCCF684